LNATRQSLPVLSPGWGETDERVLKETGMSEVELGGLLDIGHLLSE
jgi:hypothetical protein